MEKEINVVKAGNQFLEAYYEKHPEWKEMNKLKDELNEESIDYYTGDQLSQLSLKMNGYMVRLSVMVAAATAATNEAYLYRKYRYFSVLNSTSSKITKAQLEAEEGALKQKEDEAIKQYISDVLRGKLKAYENLVSSIQTRIGYLKTEIINSKYS